MNIGSFLLHPLAPLYKSKEKSMDKFTSDNTTQDTTTSIISSIIGLAIFGYALYIAGTCGKTFGSWLAAFFFPFIYIIYKKFINGACTVAEGVAPKNISLFK